MTGHVVGHTVGHTAGACIGKRTVSIPSALSGAVLWFDPLYNKTFSGPNVIAIADRINGYVASWGTAAQCPTYAASGSSPGGAPALVFDSASAQRLVCTASGALLTALQTLPYTVYWWGRVTSLAATRIPWCTTLPSAQYGNGILSHWVAAGTINMFYSNGASIVDSGGGRVASINTDYWQYAEHRSTTDRRHRLRGTAEYQHTTSLAWAGNVTTICLGIRYSSSVFQQPMHGEMCGWCLFPGQLDASEHAEMQAYIDGEMGL